MSRMMFTNLPVADLPRTRGFFESLGFGFNENFSDETAACLVITPDVAGVMLLTHDKWRQFTDKPIADPRATSSVLVALSCESREAVNAIADAAIALGATAPRPPEDYGFMLTRAIEDFDGHTWEFFHMDMAAMAAAHDRKGD
jgi:predicted lactoylglutathione lyase